MPHYIDVTGKGVDDAIAAGCKQLGLERDAVSVEVLHYPQKGFLGINSQPALVRLSYESTEPEQVSVAERGGKAVDFLKDVLQKMGIAATVSAADQEEGLRIEVSGPDMGIVIGRRGETLDALQYLTSLVANRGEEEYCKVTIDTENYRAKRKETLERLAHKMAAKVQKYHRNVSLEPMNPYERRIIHSALQGVDNITTHSIGSEPNRKVVITYTGSEAPIRPPKREDAPVRDHAPRQSSQGSSNFRGGRGPRSEGRSGGGDRRRDDRPAQTVSQMPSRPPRSDKELFDL